MSAPPAPEMQRVRDLCDRLGYPAALRAEGLEVWSGYATFRPDLVCFYDELHDLSTATLVCGLLQDDHERELHFNSAQALAAPLALLYDGTTWEIWNLASRRGPNDPELLGTDPDDPAIARFLGPVELRHAKTGHRQLALFDIEVDLLGRTRSALRQSLDGRVREAMIGLVGVGLDPLDRRQAERATQLVLQALVLLAVRDKLTADRRLSTAWSVLEDRFPDEVYADVTFRSAVEEVAADIGQGINFSALDAALLGDVYEHAIIEPSRRSDLGAFYTPPSLGRKILANLPVESLNPARRSFLDLACGSGTLLLAANDRLGGLVDDLSIAERQDYVRQRLTGYDSDPFAVGLARLALLIHALPLGNGFKISERDVLTEPPAGQANVLVSNPPWQQRHAGGPHTQLADAFLRRMIDLCSPGGLIACILPLSWLTDRTSRDSRGYAQTQLDVFETWRLPEDMFRTTRWAPCVVFAQKNAYHGFTTARYVKRSSRERFLTGSPADETLLGRDPFIAAYETRREVDKGPLLSQAAIVKNGAPVSDIKALRDRNSGIHVLLDRHGSVDAMTSIRRDQTIAVNYPQDFSHRSGEPGVYLEPKVLVTAIRWQDNPWRLKTLLDEIGVIPRNQLTAVVPRENSESWRLFLFGLLSAGYPNAWIDSRCSTRMIPPRELAMLPLPAESAWEGIAVIGRAVLNAADGDSYDAELIAELEERVTEAYELAPADETRFMTRLAGQSAPEGWPRYEAVSDDHEGLSGSTILTGSVLATGRNRIRIHLPGMTPDDGTWVPPPASMPGYMMREGSTFLVRGAERGLDSASFVFHRSSWEDPEDLLAEFEGWRRADG